MFAVELSFGRCRRLPLPSGEVLREAVRRVAFPHARVEHVYVRVSPPGMYAVVFLTAHTTADVEILGRIGGIAAAACIESIEFEDCWAWRRDPGDLSRPAPG